VEALYYGQVHLLIVEMDAFLIFEKDHLFWWGWENITLA
jgi:hypothetical protein